LASWLRYTCFEEQAVPQFRHLSAVKPTAKKGAAAVGGLTRRLLSPVMGIKRASTFHNIRGAASFALGFTFAVTLVLISALAAAQEQAAPGQKTRENESFMATVGRWFEEQTANVSSSFRDARKKVESFGSAASDAAKTTVEGARDAADAVVRIPTARAVSGHEKCLMAPNGAPDCVSAANTICKAKGFGSGKSVDMTTSEVCPPKVYMSGRSTGPECKTETFVSRALCQ
jgi:hypothetical protein